MWRFIRAVSGFYPRVSAAKSFVVLSFVDNLDPPTLDVAEFERHTHGACIDPRTVPLNAFILPDLPSRRHVARRCRLRRCSTDTAARTATNNAADDG